MSKRASKRVARKVSKRKTTKKPATKNTTSTKERAASIARAMVLDRRVQAAAVARELDSRKRSFEQEYKKAVKSDGRRLEHETLGVASLPFTILAEGDSWFDYPVPRQGGGAIDSLDRLFKRDRVRCIINNLAHYGHTVQGMLGVDQRERLREELAEAVAEGRPYKALLFSGGGNDIAGDQFLFWIKRRDEAASIADAIDETPFRAILTIIEKGYRDLIRLRNETSPATVLIVHAYDFPPEFGEGVCFIGPWLKPSLDYRGWSASEYFGVVKRALERFASMLAALAADPANRMLMARTQGALPDKNQWDNELHPNAAGFQIIAQRLRDALRTAFPGEAI